MDDWKLIKLLFEIAESNDPQELEKLNKKAQTMIEKEKSKDKRDAALVIVGFAVIVLFISFGFAVATSNLPDWFKFFLLG